MNFFLGCAVWGYKGWVGELFPPKTSAADFLHLYSQRLTAVEGNTTFYAVPDQATIARWAAQTTEGFKFCPKLPRQLTHGNLLEPSIPGALKFLEQMQGLKSRLGPLFAQLPPSYGPSLLNDLTAFLKAWSSQDAPLALEVRHPDWFKPPHADNLNALLEQLGIGRVLLDTRPAYSGSANYRVSADPRKPKVPLQPVVTAPFTLVRFISHPEQQYNQAFLAEWVTLVDQWLRQGTQVYFFVHCPIEVHSPATARYFQQLLESQGAPVPPLPWNAIDSSPTQLSLFPLE
jgi:uncharacterized protein YecE (DUF72 family)